MLKIQKQVTVRFLKIIPYLIHLYYFCEKAGLSINIIIPSNNISLYGIKNYFSSLIITIISNEYVTKIL